MAETTRINTGNAPGRIETHGTDFVPESERRGRPRSLFGVWAGSNITYLYFVLGGLLILFGLDVWQAILVVLAGNLFWIGVGYLATSGPAAGMPSQVISRVFYGVRANRIVNFCVQWLVGVLYEAINLTVGALAGLALVQLFMGDAPVLLQVALVIGLAIVTFTISVYGQATILRLGPWFTTVLLIGLAVLAIFVVTRADFSYVPEGGSLSGGPLWATMAAGFAIIASAPLSWQVGADMSRYLPSRVGATKVAFWTAFGGFIPATTIAILGVLAGTVIDMSNPQESMAQILPTWFYAVFLLIIMIGSIANNALTAYSTGLALLAVGVTWRRSITVIFDGVIAVAVTLYALLISNFLDTVSGLLETSLAILAPAMAIYSVDIFLRHNRYSGPSMQDTSRGSNYWYFGGFNPGGFGALVVGAAASFLCLNTSFWVGPFAHALGGADVSIFVGIILGGGIYWITQSRRILARLPLSEEQGTVDFAQKEVVP